MIATTDCRVTADAQSKDAKGIGKPPVGSTTMDCKANVMEREPTGFYN